MNTPFEELMAKKSDEALMDYVININRYTPEAVMVAVNELNKRGRPITDGQLEDIKRQIQEKVEGKKKEMEKIRAANSWTKNIVDNADAPEYYSQQAVFGFSIVFTVLFGAILLSMNVADKKGQWIIVGFGVLYSTIAIIVLEQIKSTTGIVFVINAGGAYFLSQVFWNMYLGKDTQYRKKPIWKPLIVSIVITIPIAIAIIYGDKL